MALWTLFVWGFGVILLTPLTSWVVGHGWFRGPDGLVGNEQILAWLFTLPGLAFVVVAGALALIGSVLHYSGLHIIVTDDLEGRPVGVLRTALRLLPHLPVLLRLSAFTVAAAALLALPLAAGLLGVHALLLAAHDINYYLAHRPPEWHRALALGGAWTLAWALGVALPAARHILALPATLDGHPSLRRALRRSREVTRGRGRDLLHTLLATLALWLGLRAMLLSGFALAIAFGVEGLAGIIPSLRLLALAAAAGTALAIALDAVLGFLGFALLSTVLAKFYHEDSGLHLEPAGRPRLRAIPRELRARAHPFLRPGRAVPGMALLALGSFALGGVLLERVPEPRAVEVHAHRTGPPPSPENTLAALERSIEAGADYAEIDVQRTRDGVIVVVHDADLMRVARDPRRVGATDFAELAGVVQEPDDGTPPSERGVATLDSFLERARGRIGLNIELKVFEPDPGLAPAVVDKVRAHGMEAEVVLMSLDLGVVRELRTLAPEIPAGWVATVAVGDPTEAEVDFLAVPTPQFSPALLRRARARGMRVFVWTVNDRPTMIELVRRGADGIITAAPALVVEVNRELEAMPVAGRILLGVGRR